MSIAGGRIARLTLAMVPAVILTLGCCVRLLPHHVLVHAISALTAWLTLSLLVGVVVGHCALGEADYP